MTWQFAGIVYGSISLLVGCWMLLCSLIDGTPEDMTSHGSDIALLYHVMVFMIGFLFWPYLIFRAATKEKKDGKCTDKRTED